MSGAPIAKRRSEGCAIASDNAESPETSQDIELATPGAPESMAAAAADVDNAKNIVLEGEKSPDCAIVVEFIDEGAGVTAINLEMRCMD